MTTTADAGLKAWLPGFHEALVLILVGLRPLISGHSPGSPDQILWTALVLVGIGVQSLENCTGPGRPRCWGATGIAAVITLLLLLPAAAGATLPTAQGWNLWIGWASLGLFALYLAGFDGPRRRLVIAALGAALAVQGILAVVQHVVVHPRMLAQLAAGDGDIGIIGQRLGPELVAERLRRGGAYGTLSLANALSVFVLMVGLPLAGLGWCQVLRPWWRRRLTGPATTNGVIGPTQPVMPLIIVALLGLLGLVTMLYAGARGGAAMAALAGTIWVAWRGRGHPRWFVPGLLIGAALVLYHSAVLDANITVRTRYWQAAWDLFMERPWRGWGLDGYAEQAGRVLSIDAEYSRLAHNAVIDAAVAAGLTAALALTALLLLLVGKPPAAQAPPDDHTDLARPRRLAWLLALALPYAAAFEALDSDNLAFWPGGAHIAVVLAYATGLGLIMALVARALLRLPAAPALSLWWAVATFALACLIDFHLHNLALAGSAIALALALRRPAERPPAPLALRRLAPVLWLVLVVAAAWAWQRGQQLTTAETTLDQLEALRDPRRGSDRPALLADLSHRLGLPSDEPRRLIVTALDNAEAAVDGWPQAPQLALRLATLTGDHQRIEALAEALPDHLPAWVRLADSRARRGELEGAIRAQRRAVSLHPAGLDLHLQLAAYLRRLSDDHDQATALRAEAAAIEDQVEKLTPIVHPAHRPSGIGTK